MSATAATTSPPGVPGRGPWRSTVAALAVIAALAGCDGSGDAPADAESEPTLVPSGDCGDESTVVQDARRASARFADIDGDGADDAVYRADDPGADPACRRFVVVDTGDVTYSARASVLGHPESGATVFRLIQLGGSDGAEIVFSTYGGAAGAATVYRIFTFSEGRVRRVDGPYSKVVDAGPERPVGAGCSDGRLVVSALVVSEVAGSDPARPRTVQRRFFVLDGDRLEPRGRTTRRVAPGPIDAALPEFTRPLFGGC